MRNLSEYGGDLKIDERLLGDLLRAAETVETAVSALGPVPSENS
jgi:hypothetical protein